MDRRLLDLDHLGPGGRQLAKLDVHRAGHVPDQLLLVLEAVLGRMAVEEDREHLRRAGPELDGLAGARAGLGDPPELGVLERIARVVLDLADDARPAPVVSISFISVPAANSSSRSRERRTGAPRARAPSSVATGSGADERQAKSSSKAGSRRSSACRARRALLGHHGRVAHRGTSRGIARRAAPCRAAGPTALRRTSVAVATSR